MTIVLLMLAVAAPLRPAFAQNDTTPRTRLTGEIDLARIVDLACQRRGIEVRYDKNDFKSTRAVTVRSVGAGLTDDELWDLCQRSLARNGLTTIMEPGESRLQVVKIAEAKNLAQLEFSGAATADAGYVTVLLRVQHAVPQTLVSSVKPLLSRPGGDLTRIGDGDLVLLSELSTRLNQAMELIALLDQKRDEPAILRLTPEYLRPSQLVVQVALATKSREALVGRGLEGALIPMLDDSSMLLVAPEDEVPMWQAMIQRFDVPQETATVSYRPARHAMDDVANLIEQTARVDGPRGSGDKWKIVQDTLTQALIVTATVAEHEAIAAVIERLDQETTGGSTDIRRIRVRNRELSDLHDTLNALLDVGMIASVTSSGSGAAAGGRGSSQRDTARGGRDSGRSGSQNSGGADTVLSTSQDGIGRDRESRRQRPERIASPGVQVSGNDEVTITTDPTTASLIVMGPPRLLDQIEALVLELDVREPQVMLEVLIVSLDERELLDLGVELEKIEISGGTVINLQSLFNLSGGSSGDSGGSVADPRLSRGEGLTGLVLNPGDFSVVIRALQSISNGRTLVMPKVLVNNGEQALLDSVRREPVQSTNASNTVATTSFNGTVDAGTKITVTPQIAEGDHLLLEYDISLSAFVGESASPNLPPPQQENTISSLVTIPDGHTVVLGGLETHTTAEGVSKVPFFGDIPILGELFKNRSTTDSVSRFYVFIRSTILRHDGFEDLRYLSDQDRIVAGIDDGWPVVNPRVVR